MRSLFTIATLTTSISAFGHHWCNDNRDCDDGEVCTSTIASDMVYFNGECLPAHHNEVEENNRESLAFGRHDFDDGHWGHGYEHGSSHQYTDFDTHLYDQVPEGQ